jgi:hypothetical protein
MRYSLWLTFLNGPDIAGLVVKVYDHMMADFGDFMR